MVNCLNCGKEMEHTSTFDLEDIYEEIKENGVAEFHYCEDCDELYVLAITEEGTQFLERLQYNWD